MRLQALRNILCPQLRINFACKNTDCILCINPFRGHTFPYGPCNNDRVILVNLDLHSSVCRPSQKTTKNNLIFKKIIFYQTLSVLTPTEFAEMNVKKQKKPPLCKGGLSGRADTYVRPYNSFHLCLRQSSLPQGWSIAMHRFDAFMR